VTHPFAVTLAAAIVSFYLIDSAMLLYANELLLVETRGTWTFAVPRFEVLGKRAYLPNPLLPDAVPWRIFWSPTHFVARPDRPDALEPYFQALLPMRYLSVGLLMLLIVAAPMALLIAGPRDEVLWLFAAIYCLIIGMLVQLYRKREVLGVSSMAFLKLAFDSLICPPLAVNLVRKVGLTRQIPGDPIAYSRELFDDATFRQLVEAVCRQVDEQSTLEDEETPQHESLIDYRTYLKRLIAADE